MRTRDNFRKWSPKRCLATVSVILIHFGNVLIQLTILSFWSLALESPIQLGPTSDWFRFTLRKCFHSFRSISVCLRAFTFFDLNTELKRWLAFSAKSFAFSAMNNCELYLAYIYSPFSLISLRNLLYNSPKLPNTYKQTSTVIYNRLLVITDGNKSASSSYFESCLPLVRGPFTLRSI